MKIEVRVGAIEEQETPLVVVNLFEGITKPGGATAAVDRQLGGMVQELLSWGDAQGKLNEASVLYVPRGLRAKRVLVVGLGKREEFDLDKVRQVAATVARKVQSLGVTSYCTILHGTGAGGLDPVAAAQALTEGTHLSQYRFDQHRTEKDEQDQLKELDTVSIIVPQPELLDAVTGGVRIGEAVSAAVQWARDWVNQPANYATPAILAEASQSLAASKGLRVQVLGPKEMDELGMGALLAVAQGSTQEPRFVILEHKPRRVRSAPVVLVGKGITFDSGGISIKPSEHMEAMKGDMAGAATVIATMGVVADLDLPLHVVGLIPATENLPSGSAYRPGDVLKTILGKTIEVISTDAEGRLILADALGYAQQYKPEAIVDLATLTGACVVALGNVAAGLFSNNDALAAKIEAASQITNERVWRLPLWKEYAQQIKSDVADMKNSGGRPAGAITGAMLLSKFVGDYAWAHLDIAGMNLTDKDTPFQGKGATGYGVRLLVELLRDWK